MRRELGLKASCFFLVSPVTHHELPSVEHPRMNIRPVNRRVTSGAPAGTLLQKRGMVSVANIDLTLGHITPLNLRMALQAKVWIAFDQHLSVNRTVWSVTNGAPLA